MNFGQSCMGDDVMDNLGVVHLIQTESQLNVGAT